MNQVLRQSIDRAIDDWKRSGDPPEMFFERLVAITKDDRFVLYIQYTEHQIHRALTHLSLTYLQSLRSQYTTQEFFLEAEEDTYHILTRPAHRILYGQYFQVLSTLRIQPWTL
jgi:hypothetical protein